MVNIKLNETHTLTSDSNNWTISENDKPIWFYCTLESALKDWYFNENPKGSRAKDEHQLIKHLENAMKCLKSTLNTITEIKRGGKK